MGYSEAQLSDFFDLHGERHANGPGVQDPSSARPVFASFAQKRDTVAFGDALGHQTGRELVDLVPNLPVELIRGNCPSSRISSRLSPYRSTLLSNKRGSVLGCISRINIARGSTRTKNFRRDAEKNVSIGGFARLSSEKSVRVNHQAVLNLENGSC
jgi:hypothetical protein